MLFSIVIPTFNRAEAIGGTLSSVIEQDFEDFECIIVDDGSKDYEDLSAVVAAFNDDRIVLISQENGGGGAARNAGILAARGKWVCFLDSDDAFLPNKLSTIAAAIKISPDVNVWSHFTKMERGNNVSIVRPRRIPRAEESVSAMMFKEREFLQTSTLTVETAFARKVLFDSGLRKAQDVDFMWRAELNGLKLGFVPIVLSIWNDRPAANRVGSPRKAAAVQNWFDRNKHRMSVDIRRSFEATYLAYEISRLRPWRSILYISRATACGYISMRMAGVTMLRCFLPGRLYRFLVDRVLNGRLKVKSSWR